MNSSRLLTKLDAAIAEATDLIESDSLKVERACYLARRGQYEEADAVLRELRKRYERQPNVRMSAWLSLAEGLVIHFSNMGERARDKILRAYALSAAARLTQVQAISAAWLANMDYLQVDMVGMARYVGEALRLASPDNHSALSRANLVVAHAYHLSARLDLARPWYSRAHSHAAAEGDDVTIGALMHNMAWLRAANLRQETFCGRAVSSNSEHALVGTESTLQFDTLFGATSLDALAQVLRAQILVVQGQFGRALAIFEHHLQSALDQGMERMHASLLADQALCKLKLGRAEDAMQDARTAESQVTPTGQFDDRAPAHSRLAQVFAALGAEDAASRHRTHAEQTWQGHENLQRNTLEILAKLNVGSLIPSGESN